MAYDDGLRQKLTNKRKLEELWQQAMLEEDFFFAYSLKPPVELSKSAGRIHEVNAWAAFWKQADAPWHLLTANKQAGIMGKQNDFPKKAEFRSAEEALKYLREWQRFQRLQTRCAKISRDFPQLRSLCGVYRQEILSTVGLEEKIWQLAHYFSGNYRRDCYLRELDIPYVDTKFMEKNKKLTADIFFVLHPEEEGHSFKDLCTLLNWQVQAPTPNIYLRSLDKRKTIGGLQELMVTAEQLARLAVSFSRIFFTENKLNGFVFPEVEDGLMIFGAGNGVVAESETIPWLVRQEKLWYWGDIDRDGFRILSRVREKYPQVRSFLMGKELAKKYSYFMTADTGKKGEMPSNLTDQEQDCWCYLAEQPLGMSRLEQEKIPLHEVKGFLQSCGIAELQDEL
ncbi:MAG: hypothetical protein K6F95_08400 [Selenomonas sp.]|uniref:DUF3322 and DUF2220 domain-containing protein n=1 Tax=Selenomonas sp. TaxID=2053611 RepID=UPI0025D9F38E|nr:DUF3322 and DUF2220 domain-containing protein [Selenomonas sp.]MCR5757911.1 hypothetical protein [Selenomonas sp.]